MSSPDFAQSLRSLSDRAAITDVVTAWGFARDSGRWDRLRACFSADGTMHTTWFVGSADEFVERSKAASQGPVRGQHFIGACAVELKGERAIAETRMTLLLRGPLDGVVVDVTCYGRFYDLFRREDGVWRIQKRVPIYEKDRLDAVDPAAKVMLDRADLERHPEGYRHIAYVQSRGGSQVTQGLPTPGSDALANLYAEGKAWLAKSA